MHICCLLFCLLIGLPSLAAQPSSFSSSRGAKDRQPNIILIYADDLGMGCLGCYGQEVLKTPHIDRLANQGMLFTRVYSSPYCCPARASLLMGVHDSHSRSYTQTPGGMEIEMDRKGVALSMLDENVEAARAIKPGANEVFLPELMKKAGYVTGQFGKLDWGFMASPSELKRHGWDEYVGYMDHVRAHGFYPPYLWKNGKPLILEGNTLADAGKTQERYTPETSKKRRGNRAGKAVYAPDVLLEETLDFMQRHRTQPMFIFFSTNLPHGPVDVPPAYLKSMDMAAVRKAGRAAGIPEPEIDAAEEYAAMVQYLDDQVGSIVEKVKELGLEEDTVIVFASDNGHELYYRQNKALGHANNYHGGVIDGTGKIYDVFRGNRGTVGKGRSMVDFSNLKWSDREGGLRVPMIVWAPGRVRAGSSSDALIANYDHMAAFADLAGVPLPEGKDAVSYAPLLDGGNLAPRPYVVVNKMVVTQDGWKLIKEKGKELLFDLNADAGERRDLSAEKPEALARLRAVFSKEVGSPRRDKE